MKKNTIFSFIISSAISIACLLINLICALSCGFLPIGIEFSGGEFTESIGFGISLQTIYSFGTIEEASTTTTVGFDLMSLLIPFILLFLIVFVVKTVASKSVKKDYIPS